MLFLNKTVSVIALFLFTALVSCDNGDGLFGHSKTKQDAKANGSVIVEYIPTKKEFKLLDGTQMIVDTAWTEISFSYKNGKRILDSSYGYHFSIPFKKEKKETFTFSFALADSTNRIFTNGMDEDMEQLCPKHLYDTMIVLVEQMNPDTSLGWIKPIITDTIAFIKIK